MDENLTKWLLIGGAALGGLLLVIRPRAVGTGYSGTLESMAMQSQASVQMHAQSTALDAVVAQAMVERAGINAQLEFSKQANEWNWVDNQATNMAILTGATIESMKQQSMQQHALEAQIEAFKLSNIAEQRALTVERDITMAGIRTQERTTMAGIRTQERITQSLAKYDYEKSLGLANIDADVSKTIEGIRADTAKFITDITSLRQVDIARIQGQTARYIAKQQRKAAESASEGNLIGEIFGTIFKAVAAYYTGGASLAVTGT